MPYLVRFEIDDDWQAPVASTQREQFTRGNGSRKRKRRTRRRRTGRCRKDYGRRRMPVRSWRRSGETWVRKRSTRHTRAGKFISLKRGRGRFMRILAVTLPAPDEIWVSLDPMRKDPGKWKVFRRYPARFSLPGMDAPGIAVLEWTNKGWCGVTTFQGARLRDPERRRREVLPYRREN